MKPTTDFIAQAQAVIVQVLNDYKPKLVAAHGNVAEEIKSDTTPVTALDKELETLIRDALTKLDAGIGQEGEEHGKAGNAETFWLIDPIDGTESFVRGLPFVRNMVTLIDGGEPVYALVNKPFSNELFTAQKGGGSFKNGQAVHIGSRPLSRAWIELSAPLGDNASIPVVQAVRKQINGFRTLGEFTYVVEGKIDGQLIYKSGGGPWDYAPRALMVAEAGGRVANIGSDSYDYRNNDVLMANSVIFDDLMATINSVIALGV